MDRDVEGGSGTFLLDGTWRQEDFAACNTSFTCQWLGWERAARGTCEVGLQSV